MHPSAVSHCNSKQRRHLCSSKVRKHPFICTDFCTCIHHHSIKFMSTCKISVFQPTTPPPKTQVQDQHLSQPHLLSSLRDSSCPSHHPSREIHSHTPPLPHTPRHKHNRSDDQNTSDHSPDHHARDLFRIKCRPALDLEPIRQSGRASPVGHGKIFLAVETGA